MEGAGRRRCPRQGTARYNPQVRRIGRHILNGLTVLSLVLCFAMVALWVRSLRVYDSLNWETTGSLAKYEFECLTGNGGILIRISRERFLDEQREFMIAYYRKAQRGIYYLKYPYRMPSEIGLP